MNAALWMDGKRMEEWPGKGRCVAGCGAGRVGQARAGVQGLRTCTREHGVTNMAFRNQKASMRGCKGLQPCGGSCIKRSREAIASGFQG